MSDPDDTPAPAPALAEPPAPASTAEPAEPVALTPVECGQRLAALFPALFAGPPRPLKLRIHVDIQARAPGVFTRAALSAFMHRHTLANAYLRAVAQGGQRYDLDGQPAGELADEHRQAAVDELARRRERFLARRAAERGAAPGAPASGPAPAQPAARPGAQDAAAGSGPARPPAGGPRERHLADRGGRGPARPPRPAGAPGGAGPAPRHRDRGPAGVPAADQPGVRADARRGPPGHTRPHDARGRHGGDARHDAPRDLGRHPERPPHPAPPMPRPPAAVEPADPAQRERALLLRDVERTTLTLANFCALKGLLLPAVEAQLELARRERAGRGGGAR